MKENRVIKFALKIYNGKLYLQYYIWLITINCHLMTYCVKILLFITQECLHQEPGPPGHPARWQQAAEDRWCFLQLAQPLVAQRFIQQDHSVRLRHGARVSEVARHPSQFTQRPGELLLKANQPHLCRRKF